VCGIVGLVVQRNRDLSVPLGRVIVECLERLEYRGYDSVGLACVWDGVITIRKGKGKIAEVNSLRSLDSLKGMVGIGHTRWATHGKPNDVNAHPHSDCSGKVVVVHNGIIANYLALKEELVSRGHRFVSETDTEVFAHLVEDNLGKGVSPYEAFKASILRLNGSYSFVALISGEPDKIFFARRNSPLVLGISDHALFVASDIPAFLEYTNKVVTVNDDEVGYISRDGAIELQDIMALRDVSVSSRARVIGWTAELARKAGYPHFMIKEIHEQPSAIRETIAFFETDLGLKNAANMIHGSKRVFFLAAGTAYYAGLAGRDALIHFAQTPAFNVVSSEYLLHAQSIDEGDIVIAVSQSGETIDTLMGLRAFRERGAKVITLTNVLDSAIAREGDLRLYTKAGPEIGVAATKTFATQLIALQMLAEKVGLLSGNVTSSEEAEFLGELHAVPSNMEKNINLSEAKARELSRVLKDKPSMYYLSRGKGVPVAKEGALKIKEVAYIHAEAYEAGESKHGPISLVTKFFPVLFVFSDAELVDLTFNNLMEMKSRDAYTIGVLPRGNRKLVENLDYSFELYASSSLLNTALFLPPLQLLAYYLCLQKGFDPDKPRNLAKTVTVE
jgi:glucosamine--fructose-6-phosphate aminotransferase (isomerizing)